MRKSFKQVSTGLTLVCEREDVIEQYEKYPDQYIPLGDTRNKKSVRSAQKAQAAQNVDPESTKQAPDKPEKQENK